MKDVHLGICRPLRCFGAVNFAHKFEENDNLTSMLFTRKGMGEKERKMLLKTWQLSHLRKNIKSEKDSSLHLALSFLDSEPKSQHATKSKHPVTSNCKTRRIRTYHYDNQFLWNLSPYSIWGTFSLYPRSLSLSSSLSLWAALMLR